MLFLDRVVKILMTMIQLMIPMVLRADDNDHVDDDADHDGDGGDDEHDHET